MRWLSSETVGQWLAEFIFSLGLFVCLLQFLEWWILWLRRR